MSSGDSSSPPSVKPPSSFPPQSADGSARHRSEPPISQRHTRKYFGSVHDFNGRDATVDPHDDAPKKCYIVYFGPHSHGRDATIETLAAVENSHYEFLSTFLGSYERAKKAIYSSCKWYINSFAATLTDEEASKIAEHPNVLSVFLSRTKQLLTTHSWHFMGLNFTGSIDQLDSTSLLRMANLGEDIIIGHIDSGVWLGSKSFNDEEEEYTPTPSRWRGAHVPGFPCNRKVIGAQFFFEGIEQLKGIEVANKTPWDYNGHGTHTLSISGGNFVRDIDFFGLANGSTMGGCPRARLASYKVCWADLGCEDGDLLSAIDTAVYDGVDVLSISMGSADLSNYLADSIALGSFYAVKNGIPVVCAAGNFGSRPQTVTNLAPWIITVGASTIDRQFETCVKLRTKDGVVVDDIKGASFSNPRAYFFKKDEFYPIVLDDGSTLDRKKVLGKILVCHSDPDNFGQYAVEMGAVGVIFYNSDSMAKELDPKPYLLPAINISFEDGAKIIDYVKSTKEVLGSITAPRTKYGVEPAPFVASFSSRGPNPLTPEILKPDIIAPGVDIIAGYTVLNSPCGSSFDHRAVPYMMMSGTSMACPHVSGVVGLVKKVHPHWSPAAVKSAIMTTAMITDRKGGKIVNFDDREATPFDYGSGHINPGLAVDPGLVYDMGTTDYVSFLWLCGYDETKIVELFLGEGEEFKSSNLTSLMDLNYPAIMVPNLDKTAIVVTRRLKNVGTAPATYEVAVSKPEGVNVKVEPTTLRFERTEEEKEFKVTFEKEEESGRNPELAKQKDYYFGSLTWSDGNHSVRSPIGIAFSVEENQSFGESYRHVPVAGSPKKRYEVLLLTLMTLILHVVTFSVLFLAVMRGPKRQYVIHVHL